MALLTRLALAATLLAGCGLGGAEGGGAERLPTAGAGPYAKPSASTKTPAEEPYVIVDAQNDLRDPAALAAPDGGFDLWFTHTPAAGGASAIWYAHLRTLTELPDVGPEPSFAAADAWEQGSVSAPSVVELGDGRRVLYYQAGAADAPAIGRATSSDGGRTWTREGQVLDGGLAPSALVVEGHTFLYFGDPDGHAIALAEADGDAPLVISDAAVITPSSDPLAFDVGWVGEPDAVGGRTAAGQLHIDLFYVGRSSNQTYAIACSASFEGHTFMPFLAGKPVLEAESPDDRGPAAVLAPDLGVLFFHQQRAARSVIAVATSPG